MNNTNMSPALARKMRYLKDRCSNALWMVRNGEFKLILKSIAVEIRHRIRDIREWRKQVRKLDDSQVQGSVFVNRCKVVPPSRRPTQSQFLPSIPLQADPVTVANELKSILTALPIQEAGNT